MNNWKNTNQLLISAMAIAGDEIKIHKNTFLSRAIAIAFKKSPEKTKKLLAKTEIRHYEGAAGGYQSFTLADFDGEVAQYIEEIKRVLSGYYAETSGLHFKEPEDNDDDTINELKYVSDAETKIESRTFESLTDEGDEAFYGGNWKCACAFWGYTTITNGSSYKKQAIIDAVDNGLKCGNCDQQIK